jgi:hypothetical protein
MMLKESTIKEKMLIKEYFRKTGNKFISADLKGTFGKMFKDIGKKFNMFDKKEKNSMMSLSNQYPSKRKSL